MTVSGAADLGGIVAFQFDEAYRAVFKQGILNATGLDRAEVNITSVVDVVSRHLQEEQRREEDGVDHRRLLNSVQVNYDVSFVVEDQNNMTIESASAVVDESIQESVSSNQLSAFLNEGLSEALGIAYQPILVNSAETLGTSVEVLASVAPTSAPSGTPLEPSVSTPPLIPPWVFVGLGSLAFCLLTYAGASVYAHRRRSSKVYIDDGDSML